MSGTGPDSIPVSADPRSKRPTKKRALTPVSAQASHLSTLFAHPDQEIRLPPPTTTTTTTTTGAGPGASSSARRLPLPPEIVTNVQGSSAGAGSGEFHVYKAARRREYERLRAMDAEVAAETAQREFEVARAARADEDRGRTERNRVKRDKMKARKQRAKEEAAAGAKAGAKQTDKGGRGASGGAVQARVVGASMGNEGGEGDDGKRDNNSNDNNNNKMDVDTATGAEVVSDNAPGLLIHDDDD